MHFEKTHRFDSFTVVGKKTRFTREVSTISSRWRSRQFCYFTEGFLCSGVVSSRDPTQQIQLGGRTKGVVWCYHCGSSCSGAEHNPHGATFFSVSLRALVSDFLLKQPWSGDTLPTANRIELRTLRISGKLVIELKHVPFKIDYEVIVHLILINLAFLSPLRPKKPSGTVWPLFFLKAVESNNPPNFTPFPPRRP